MKTFADRVRDVVRAIPEGVTMTYGEVATLAGSPGASRAVGMIMKKNYDPAIPCHRVVKRDSVGGYNRGGPEKKREMLEAEKRKATSRE